MTDLLRRDFQAVLAVRAAGDPEERIIEGIAVPFGQVVDVRDGPNGKPYREVIARGATDSIEAERVTVEALTRSANQSYNTHDGAVLVGRGISATHSEAGTFMALRIARTAAGDEVLELAREGVLTDLSVAFAPVSQRIRPDGVVERTAIDVRRVAVVERGAYSGAQITAVRAEPDGDISEDPPPDPPPPEPEPIKDPPKGGSLHVRSKHKVDYLSREEKVSRLSELKETIARQATETDGELSVEAKARWDADNKEHDELERAIRAWDDRQDRLRVIATKEDQVEAPERGIQPWSPPVERNQINRGDVFDMARVEQEPTKDRRDQMYRDNAMRITEVATFPHPATDTQKTRDRMAWLLDEYDTPDKQLAKRFMATGSPLYRRAFQKLVLNQPLTPEEQRGTALAVGVDGTGGFAIPVIFDLSVIAIGVHSGAVNPYRATCRVVPIVGTDTWNALTATVVTATRTTEAAPAIEQGPTFAQPQYIVKRVQAQITYSLEVAQDRTDIASEMAVLIGEAKDNEEETSWAVGAGGGSASIGVGPVSGTSGSYTALNTASGLVIVEGDLTATEAALPVRHRFNAQWFFNRTNIRKIQSLETTGGKLFGGSIYFPSVGQVDLSSVGNTGLRLLGYPVNESPSLPTSTATTITVGTLLNPQQYVIVDRIGMSLQIIPFIFGASQGNLATGQQALYAMWRNTAAPLNVDAGRTLRFL